MPSTELNRDAQSVMIGCVCGRWIVWWCCGSGWACGNEVLDDSGCCLARLHDDDDSHLRKSWENVGLELSRHKRVWN